MALPSLQHISQRVKRRLFQNDEEEKRFEQRPRKRKSSISAILFITTQNDSKDGKYIVERARCVTPETEVIQCLPQQALDACNRKHYNLILTDIDLARSSDFIKVIFSIRRASCENQQTAIVAIKQSQTKKCNGKDLSCYEITKAFFGNLMTSELDAILIQYASNEMKQHGKKKQQDILQNNKKFEAIVNNKIKHLPKNIPVHNEPIVNLNDFRKQYVDTINANQEVPYVVFKPVAQRYQNFIQLPYMHQYPPVSRLPWNPRLNHYGQQKPMFPQYDTGCIPHPVYMNNIPYDHNRLNIFGEEPISHSLKERRRRERIKDACNQIRELLPSTSARYSKKIDMAKLLELVVMYIKLLQSSTSIITQEQCELIYQNYLQQMFDQDRQFEILADSQQEMIETNANKNQNNICYPFQNNLKYTLPTPSSNCHFIPISPAPSQVREFAQNNSTSHFSIESSEVTNCCNSIDVCVSTPVRSLSTPVSNETTPCNLTDDSIPSTESLNCSMGNNISDACANVEDNWGSSHV